MKYFHSSLQIRLEPLHLTQAAHFADAVVATIDYRDSNQYNLQKIRDDHFISKLGEEAARLVFEQYGCRVQGPDYAIYRDRAKSWEDDLYVNGVGLAIKTQRLSAARRYGLSWTFQHSPTRVDPILQKSEAWVCFVAYNDLAETSVLIVFPPFQIQELAFKPPRLARLTGKKVAVYAEDLLLGFTIPK